MILKLYSKLLALFFFIEKKLAIIAIIGCKDKMTVELATVVNFNEPNHNPK